MAATFVLTAVITVVAASDSVIAQTVLRNGIAAGDRSGLELQRPPAPGARRLPVHPRPAAGTTTPRDPRASSAKSVDADHLWFWAGQGVRLADAAPGRWRTALDALTRHRRTHGALHSADTIGALAADWRAAAVRAADRHRVSVALLLAVMAVESGGRPDARSSKGAMGLMQLVPATARRFGVVDPMDPEQNIAGGAAYLDWLLGHFAGDPLLALAAYNAGEGAVARHGGVPPYPETRRFVVKVLDALVASETACGARPTSPRSPCPGLGLSSL